jgi:hypothetical protein
MKLSKFKYWRKLLLIWMLLKFYRYSWLLSVLTLIGVVPFGDIFKSQVLGQFLKTFLRGKEIFFVTFYSK